MRCAGCFKEVRHGEVVSLFLGYQIPGDFHEKCARKRLGSKQEPRLMLPAHCASPIARALPNGTGEPNWDELKQIPFWQWRDALKQTFGGCEDPDWRISTAGRLCGPYYRWRWYDRDGHYRNKYLGKI